MTRQRPKSWVEARALITREQREYLIVRRHDEDDGPWEFPGGRVRSHESPERELRHLCRDVLGIELEIQFGQPPFVYGFGTHSATYRYYLCGIGGGEPTLAAGEVRWVLTGQLRDYVFDAPTQQVVDWLLAESRND